MGACGCSPSILLDVCVHRFCVHPNYFSDNPIGTSCTIRILGNNCSKDLKNVRAVQWCFVEAKGHCTVLVSTFRKFAAFIQVNRSELSDGDRERHNELTTAESLVRWIEWASIAAITVTFPLVCWSRWIWSRESKRESHWNRHGWIAFTVCLINCALSWTAQRVISCLPPFANVSWVEVPFLSWSDSQTGHVQMGPFSCNSGEPCMRTALQLYFCYPNFCGSVAVRAVASLWIARMVGIGILKAFLLCPDSHARPCQLLGKLAGWTGRAEKFSSMGIFKVCWWHFFFEYCLIHVSWCWGSAMFGHPVCLRTKASSRNSGCMPFPKLHDPWPKPEWWKVPWIAPNKGRPWIVGPYTSSQSLLSFHDQRDRTSWGWSRVYIFPCNFGRRNFSLTVGFHCFPHTTPWMWPEIYKEVDLNFLLSE